MWSASHFDTLINNLESKTLYEAHAKHVLRMRIWTLSSRRTRPSAVKVHGLQQMLNNNKSVNSSDIFRHFDTKRCETRRRKKRLQPGVLECSGTGVKHFAEARWRDKVFGARKHVVCAHHWIYW
jgi:hypothetical protein